MWPLKRIEEEQGLVLFVGKEQWYLDRTAIVKAPDVVTVEWPWNPRLIVEKRTGVERFIPNEVVGAAVIIPRAALGDDVDQGAAIIAILRCIVVAQYLDFGDGIL